MLIDYFVILVYLLILALIGLWVARKIKTASSFFISDRGFGKAMMTFFTFGTGTNTDQAVTVVSKTHVSGASGIWYQWLWLFATPFYWLLAPLFRRMRALASHNGAWRSSGSCSSLVRAIYSSSSKLPTAP